jgi:hypothetical protein
MQARCLWDGVLDLADLLSSDNIYEMDSRYDGDSTVRKRRLVKLAVCNQH